MLTGTLASGCFGFKEQGGGQEQVCLLPPPKYIIMKALPDPS